MPIEEKKRQRMFCLVKEKSISFGRFEAYTVPGKFEAYTVIGRFEAYTVTDCVCLERSVKYVLRWLTI